MPTTLVTGVNGFTGGYLAEELKSVGHTVVGLGLGAETEKSNSTVVCDLTDRDEMLKQVARIAPDYVVHLGGIAFAAHGDVDAIYRTNIFGTRNLLEGLTLCPNPPACVLLASSALIYGNATSSPIDEATAPAPVSDYAISKFAMETMANTWRDRLPISIVRPFNYTGAGQSLDFLLPKIVDHFRRKAARIELGNLDVVREFGDVRDVVRRYRLLLEIPAKNELLNICSGIGYSLREVLEMVKSISRHDLEIAVNPSFVRDNEVQTLIGASEKLNGLIGSANARPLDETLAWMLGKP